MESLDRVPHDTAAPPADSVREVLYPRGDAALSRPINSLELASGQRAVDFPSPVWRALRRGATRAAARLADDGVASPDFEAQLRAIVNAVHQVAVGNPKPVRVWPHCADRHFDALRREFLCELEAICPEPDGHELMLVLRALEEVYARTTDTIGSKLAKRLSGDDGLAAVIEVAHDMRSPLASVLLLVDVLRRGQSGPVTKLQERQLGLVYSAAFSLGALVGDVVDIMRDGDRLVDTQPGPLSIAEVVYSVRDLLLPVAEEKGLEFCVELPEVDGRIGHAAAISRVLLNLATNALKYTDTGSVTIAGRTVSETSIEFSVSDTGRGIPSPILRGLASTSRSELGVGTTKFSDSGLGLALCRTLLQAMGSTLVVDTAAEKGTRMSFELDLPPIPTH